MITVGTKGTKSARGAGSDISENDAEAEAGSGSIEKKGSQNSKLTNQRIEVVILKSLSNLPT